jgi:hypothetical protein
MLLALEILRGEGSHAAKHDGASQTVSVSPRTQSVAVSIRIRFPPIRLSRMPTFHSVPESVAVLSSTVRVAKVESLSQPRQTL